jgi:hypothetical protein
MLLILIGHKESQHRNFYGVYQIRTLSHCRYIFGEKIYIQKMGSLSQLAKTLVPSYYCLYSLFNKIRDKGKIVSAGY